jgi:arsenate reductase
MVTVEQEGRFQRYRANIPLMLDLIAYLTEECCSGNPGKCVDLRAASSCADALLPDFLNKRSPDHERPLPLYRQLLSFDSRRSDLQPSGSGGLACVSAGSKPAGYVHPRSLALLAREGIATEGYHSKSWDDLPSPPMS